MSVLQKVLTKYFPEIEMQDIIVMNKNEAYFESYSDHNINAQSMSDDQSYYLVIDKKTCSMLLNAKKSTDGCCTVHKGFKEDQKYILPMENNEASALMLELINIHEHQEPIRANCTNCQYGEIVMVNSAFGAGYTVYFTCDKQKNANRWLDKVDFNGTVDLAKMRKSLSTLKCSIGKIALKEGIEKHR